MSTMTSPTRGNEDRIVLMPEIAVPADIKARVAGFTERLDALTAGLADLAEEIGVTMYPHIEAVEGSIRSTAIDELREYFDEATGWGPLSDRLSDLGGSLSAAAGCPSDYSTPEWFQRLEAAKRAATIADPNTHPDLRAALERQDALAAQFAAQFGGGAA